MWIYLLYIFITLIAHFIITGESVFYVLNPGEGTQRNRKTFTWIAGTLLWAILALKDVSVGADTIVYLERYSTIQKPEFSLVSVAGQEWGYDYLQYLCRSIGMSWQVYLAFVSAIIIVPMTVFFYKYSNNIWASFFIYITIGLIGINLSALRQSLAVAMIILSMMAMFEKKYIKFVVFILIGTFFHYSALFAIVLLLVPFYKYRSNRQLVLLLLIPLIARIGGDFFLGSLNYLMPERYIDFYSEDKVMNPLLEAMWVSILLFSFYSLRINDNANSFGFRFYFLTVLFVTSIELSYGVYLASRLAYYFEAAVMISIPSAISAFQDKNTQVILSIVIYSLCLAFLIVSSFGSDTLGIYNYKFFWE